MRIVMRGAVAVCAVASFALAALGQGTLGSGAGRGPHPYTAKFRITSEQTLANGTTITRESTEILAADSEGRRFSEVITAGTGQRPEHSTFHVYDPTTKTNITWTTSNKVATVEKMPAPAEQGQARKCWSTAVDGAMNRSARSTLIVAGQPEGGVGIGSVVGSVTSEAVPAPSVKIPTTKNESTSEGLGTQMFQGVEATGRRTTTTIPTGAIGNDAPLVRMNEVWNARSIGLIVRTVTDDPQTGKRTKDLVELNQTEPDPAIFQVPEGYEVKTVEFHEVTCGQ